MKPGICFSLFLLLSSCRGILNGKIVLRTDNLDCYGETLTTIKTTPEGDNYKFKFRDKEADSRSAYLLNDSKSFYEFTIKEVDVISDSLINPISFKVRLAPGQEKWIGCTKFINSELVVEKDSIGFYDPTTLSSMPRKKLSTVVISYTCVAQKKLVE